MHRKKAVMGNKVGVRSIKLDFFRGMRAQRNRGYPFFSPAMQDFFFFFLNGAVANILTGTACTMTELLSPRVANRSRVEMSV